MKKSEINAIVKRYDKAVQAEKDAKKEQWKLQDELRKELFKFKELLIENGPLKFPKPIDATDQYGEKKVIGLFFDGEYRTLFPEGRVRMMVAENGKFDKENGCHEKVHLLAEVLMTATKVADKMISVTEKAVC